MKSADYIQRVIDELTKLSQNENIDSSLDDAEKLIVSALRNGKRIHTTGIGKPSYVAMYLASLLSSTGTKCYFLDATECVHGSSGQVDQGDVVIAISNSGKTVELIQALDTLISNGAKIIGVSGNSGSVLASKSDFHLFAGVESEGDVLNKPPRNSIIAELIILQVLSLKLQYHHNLSMREYLKWHPGGTIGETNG